MSISQEAALLEQRPAILEAQGRVRRAMGCRLEDAQIDRESFFAKGQKENERKGLYRTNR